MSVDIVCGRKYVTGTTYAALALFRPHVGDRDNEVLCTPARALAQVPFKPLPHTLARPFTSRSPDILEHSTDLLFRVFHSQ